jgi:hypothetical protein
MDEKTGVIIIGHVAHERVTILNSEYWLLNTALAEPTKEVLQAPHQAHKRGARPTPSTPCVSD